MTPAKTPELTACESCGYEPCEACVGGFEHEEFGQSSVHLCSDCRLFELETWKLELLVSGPLPRQ